MFRLGRHIAQLVHPQLQNACHDLQKASGTGGAFVVHDETTHPSLVIQCDDLGVLTADVDDGTGLRQQEVAAQRMGAQFADLLIGVLPAGPAVSGGGLAGDLLRRDTALGQYLTEDLFRSRRTDTRIYQPLGHNARAVFQQHAF